MKPDPDQTLASVNALPSDNEETFEELIVLPPPKPKLVDEKGLLFQPTVPNRKELASDDTLLPIKGLPSSENTKDPVIQEATQRILATGK